jgi:hypothetical protein
MVDSISMIRQMMAEGQMLEAQKQLELKLLDETSSHRVEHIKLYVEILQQQRLHIPQPLLLEAAEKSLATDTDQSSKFLSQLTDLSLLQKRRARLLKMKLFEKLGQLDQLYHELIQYQLYLFEKKIPVKDEVVSEIIKKYFPHDFQLKLQKLSIELMLGDREEAEKTILNFLQTSIEKSTTRGNVEKFRALADVIRAFPERGNLEIYQNFLPLLGTQVTEKKDFKKLMEAVLYFDEFWIQIQLLNDLHEKKLHDAVISYAQHIREKSRFDYVYLDKFYPQLKSLFAKPRFKMESSEKNTTEVDLSLDEITEKELFKKKELFPDTDEEALLVQSLKYQEFNCRDLIELSVSFLQSEFYRAALLTAGQALILAEDNKMWLKAAYLKLTCLYALGDYRAAIDIALTSMEKAETQDDVLSFLYMQADVYLQLNEKKEAANLYKRISRIDENYRLTRERLKRLNEI